MRREASEENSLERQGSNRGDVKWLRGGGNKRGGREGGEQRRAVGCTKGDDQSRESIKVGLFEEAQISLSANQASK